MNGYNNNLKEKFNFNGSNPLYLEEEIFKYMVCNYI